MNFTATQDLETFLDAPSKKLLINGDWSNGRSGQLIEVINPATEEIIGRVPLANREDVDEAVTSAGMAFEKESEWRRMTPRQRERILFKIADLIEEKATTLAQLITLENGKLYSEARASDVLGAANTFRYYAGWCTKLEGETLDVSIPQKGGQQNFAFTRREPVGVVAAIIPWNFPLSIAAWKVAPALSAGCTIVLKPSEETPLSALLLGKIGMEAGLPPGVLNIITGDGMTTGAALVTHPGIRKITFTGSTRTGQHIGHAAMDNLTDISLELGGKSPALVFDDIDNPTRVAKGVVAGIFRNQGQVCVAGSRVYIHKKVYDAALSEIAKAADDMFISDGFDERAQLGPLVSKGQLERVEQFLSRGIKAGGKIIAGGQRLKRKGYFMRPTIIDSLQNDHELVNEEIFGPVLVAIPFDSFDEAISLANDNRYGLAATIWTRDLSKALRAVNHIDAGIIFVNSPVRSDPNLPLGGYKHSGIGRELGKIGVYNYTTLKSVNIVY